MGKCFIVAPPKPICGNNIYRFSSYTTTVVSVCLRVAKRDASGNVR
jgi:hypothetical protein